MNQHKLKEFFSRHQLGPLSFFLFTTEDYLIFCIYSFLSACTRGQNFVKEESRKPKRLEGKSIVILFCISRGEVDVRRDFSMLYFCKFIVRRTTSFYNKEVIFFAGEGAMKSQMHAVQIG